MSPSHSDFERPPPDLSLVIPVRNAGSVLPTTLAALRAYVDGSRDRVEVVFVDDASDDAHTSASLAAFAHATPGILLLRNERRLGKGFAVRAGMRAARGSLRVFTDVDLAYPLSEVDKVVAELKSGSDVVIACRVLAESRYLIGPSFFHYLYTRHLMSRLFNAAVRAVLLPDILDTQAGLKGFRAAAADALFSRLTFPGFSFDLELLYIARTLGFEIRSLPVCFRYDDEPSTVSFMRDGLTMARDLARLRWRGWRGSYAPGPEAEDEDVERSIAGAELVTAPIA